MPIRKSCIKPLKPSDVTRDTLQRFAEGQGVVSIEPEHYTQKNDAGDYRWSRASGTDAAVALQDGVRIGGFSRGANTIEYASMTLWLACASSAVGLTGLR